MNINFDDIEAEMRLLLVLRAGDVSRTELGKLNHPSATS